MTNERLARDNRIKSRIFTDALDRIRDPEHWTQRVAARRDDGKSSHYAAEHTVCWCIAGSLNLSARNIAKEFAMSIMERGLVLCDMVDDLGRLVTKDVDDQGRLSRRLAGMNDESTHAELIEFLEDAGRKLGYLPA